MARKTAMNPDGTAFQVGPNVRLERGLHVDGDGHVQPGAQPCWIVSRKTDVADDTDTTYAYRYDEVARFDEAEDAPGECPPDALDRAQALAGEE
jgi:hypothetical protein